MFILYFRENKAEYERKLKKDLLYYENPLQCFRCRERTNARLSEQTHFTLYLHKLSFILLPYKLMINSTEDYDSEGITHIRDPKWVPPMDYSEEEYDPYLDRLLEFNWDRSIEYYIGLWVLSNSSKIRDLGRSMKNFIAQSNLLLSTLDNFRKQYY